MPNALPTAYRIYQIATTALSPVIEVLERRRLHRKGVPADRHNERFGKGYATRPNGRLIWMNAVSMGETRVALMVASDLVAEADVHVLITTTTETAARLVADHDHPNILHAYAPLDLAGSTMRFLLHWSPDLCVLVESELWPRQIVETHNAGVPIALINARLSPKSLASWSKRRALARTMLSRLSLVWTQTEDLVSALTWLGANPDTTQTFGDLKALADPLPVDEAALDRLSLEFDETRTWVAASTHPGEDRVLLEAHQILSDAAPEARLILVPRHPERGAEILALAGPDASLRSAGNSDGRILIADTLGELGLWYSLAPVAFVAGSITQPGGHNPYEATNLGCYALSGPGIESFVAAYATLGKAGRATVLPDPTPAAIAQAVAARWGRPRLEVADQARARREDCAFGLLALMEAK